MTNNFVYNKWGRPCILIDKAINVGRISLIESITVIYRLCLKKNIGAFVDRSLRT